MELRPRAGLSTGSREAGEVKSGEGEGGVECHPSRSKVGWEASQTVFPPYFRSEWPLTHCVRTLSTALNSTLATGCRSCLHKGCGQTESCAKAEPAGLLVTVLALGDGTGRRSVRAEQAEAVSTQLC